MSTLNPITVWVHPHGPNPFKVLIVLEELGLAYDKVTLLSFTHVFVNGKLIEALEITIENPKEASFLALNPNGRLPTIKDPNNGDLILWESGAIVEYIVDTYDKDNKLTLPGNADQWHLKQYLHFQMSGQGPYFGQAVWFHKSHHEDLPSAKTSYDEQIMRVFDVLNTILEGRHYLLGEKLYVVLAPYILVAMLANTSL
ncbi:glutathione S-transferase-like protein OpS6 [Metarhizium brunneum]